MVESREVTSLATNHSQSNPKTQPIRSMKLKLVQYYIDTGYSARNNLDECKRYSMSNLGHCLGMKWR